MSRFPEGFLWGAATSSYQIEGAVDVDGRGESIWDRFAAEPKNIADGTSGAGACDHYHRYPEDIELMRWLGLDAYRFSIAWPRVIPTGTGKVNEAGLGFYSRLVDGLLEAGIEPYVTIYHWDLPQALEERGGWPARATAEAFVELTDAVTRRLGDRVKSWITHNEPWCASMLGYGQGVHAPGVKERRKALAAAHHLLLSHGYALDVIRQNVRDARAGITVNLVPMEPASGSAADHDACRAAEGALNRWFLDPLYGRGYPDDVVADFREKGRLPEGPLPFVAPGDLEIIARPTDFLGVNYYSRGVVRSEAIDEAENAPRTVTVSDDKTDIGWEVAPTGLTRILAYLHERYAVPCLYVTENGAAYSTPPDQDGRVRDDKRRAYLEGHIAAARRAIDEGVPLEGYFVWSLLDNYEWAEGYTQRFGIVWVDYETQARTPKDSARWYRSVVSENGLPEANG